MVYAERNAVVPGIERVPIRGVILGSREEDPSGATVAGHLGEHATPARRLDVAIPGIDLQPVASIYLSC